MSEDASKSGIFKRIKDQMSGGFNHLRGNRFCKNI